MKKEKKNWMHRALAWVLIVVLLLGLVAMAVPMMAGAAQTDKSSSQIQQEINGLKAERAEIQAEIDALHGQMSDQMDSMEAIVAQKNLLDREIFLLHEQIANTNAQIMAYSAMIADKQAELDEAESRLADLQEKNRARIRAMEKNSTTSYWSVIFKADNFLDMLDRFNTIYKINKADRKLIRELTTAAQDVARVRDELQQQKDELEQTKLELEATQAELMAKREQADALLAELVTEYEEYEALVEQAEQNRNNVDSEIGDLQKDYQDAKDREYQQWYDKYYGQQGSTGGSTGGNAGTGNTVNGITWLVPCKYSRISSPYGWRIHPVYHDRRFHHGVDLSAPSGTPIYATRSGKVTIATYSSTAGYYVNVDHGDGFMSRYLHMTHYVVAPGQQVSAGQLLGYVGSTGTSTGPHLHLSLYYNGASVNPADYIKL